MPLQIGERAKTAQVLFAHGPPEVMLSVLTGQKQHAAPPFLLALLSYNPWYTGSTANGRGAMTYMQHWLS